MNKLIELAKQILDINPTCALSGSLSINIQGKVTRREPSDIDIYCDGTFHEFPDMKDVTEKTEEDYECEEYSRVSYKYLGVKIDVFTPVNINFKLKYYMKDGIRLIHWSRIVQFKFSHAIDNYESSTKHKDDIIYFLQNNQ